MQLQERDKEILRYCYEQQFLISEHIGKYFFQNVNKRHSYQRISELEKAGLLKRERAITIGKSSILRLTDEGRRVAKLCAPLEVPQVKTLDTATLKHDATVTCVRLRLLQLWDGIWVPERALKDKYPQIPDGLFIFHENARTIAIEIENSLKGRSRFLSILKQWEKTDGLSLVLYVATEPGIYRTLKNYLNEAPPKPAFALVLWDDLEDGTPVCHSPVKPLSLFSQRYF